MNAHCEERIGNTAIREAVHGGHPEVVAILLRAGADPTIPGWMGLSAVDEAYHEVAGGLDSPAAAAIQRLLAGFPSRPREQPRPRNGTKHEWIVRAADRHFGQYL